MAENLDRNDVMRSMMYLTKMWHNDMRKKTENMGLNESYRNILIHIMHHDGLNQREIMQKTQHSAASVSLMISQMEKDGLIYKTPNEEDKRNMHIHITPKGQAEDDKGRLMADHLTEDYLKVLTDDECVTLMTLINKVIAGRDKKKI